MIQDYKITWRPLSTNPSFIWEQERWYIFAEVHWPLSFPLLKKQQHNICPFFFFLFILSYLFEDGLCRIWIQYKSFRVVCIANISPILWFSFSIIAQSWLTVISLVFSVESGSSKNNDSFFSHSHSCYFSFKPYCTGNSLQSNYNNDDMYNHFVLILICWVPVNHMNEYYCFWNQILCALLCYISN